MHFQKATIKLFIYCEIHNDRSHHLSNDGFGYFMECFSA